MDNNDFSIDMLIIGDTGAVAQSILFAKRSFVLGSGVSGWALKIRSAKSHFQGTALLIRELWCCRNMQKDIKSQTSISTAGERDLNFTSFFATEDTHSQACPAEFHLVGFKSPCPRVSPTYKGPAI